MRMYTHQGSVRFPGRPAGPRLPAPAYFFVIPLSPSLSLSPPLSPSLLSLLSLSISPSLFLSQISPLLDICMHATTYTHTTCTCMHNVHGVHYVCNLYVIIYIHIYVHIYVHTYSCHGVPSSGEGERSGSCRCAIIGVPWCLRRLSLLSTCLNMSPINTPPKAKRAETDPRHGTHTMAHLQPPESRD